MEAALRPLHRLKPPTIDYRDRPRTNLRVLAGTLVLGITIGASGALLASMTRPVPLPAAVSAPDAAPLAAAAPKPEHAAEAGVSRERAPDAPQARDPAALEAYKASELKNALTRQSAALRACYDVFLQDEPDVAEGNVTIDFQIDPDGKVLSPGIVASELEGDALADCLVARVAGFAFPPPPDRRKTYAAHTFHFQRETR